MLESLGKDFGRVGWMMTPQKQMDVMHYAVDEVYDFILLVASVSDIQHGREAP